MSKNTKEVCIIRDPKRIDRFCDELKLIWHQFPDWRFGQLMSNMLGEFAYQTQKDIFFPEEDEMLAFFRKYAGLDKPSEESVHAAEGQSR